MTCLMSMPRLITLQATRQRQRHGSFSGHFMAQNLICPSILTFFMFFRQLLGAARKPKVKANGLSFAPGLLAVCNVTERLRNLTEFFECLGQSESCVRPFGLTAVANCLRQGRLCLRKVSLPFLKLAFGFPPVGHGPNGSRHGHHPETGLRLQQFPTGREVQGGTRRIAIAQQTLCVGRQGFCPHRVIYFSRFHEFQHLASRFS